MHTDAQGSADAFATFLVDAAFTVTAETQLPHAPLRRLTFPAIIYHARPLDHARAHGVQVQM